ncbi:hypothetical protein FRB95_005747 [Tulasnella sp. JGI-2019a]|nr:hypothetical protein FRB95_005747 [Tulasnella sp. JGI-2019a]
MRTPSEAHPSPDTDTFHKNNIVSLGDPWPVIKGFLALVAIAAVGEIGIKLIADLINSHRKHGGGFTDVEMATLVQTAKEHPKQYPAMLKKLQHTESVTKEQLRDFERDAKPSSTTTSVKNRVALSGKRQAAKRSLDDLD